MECFFNEYALIRAHHLVKSMVDGEERRVAWKICVIIKIHS